MHDSGFLRELARTAREEAAEEQQRWDRWDRLTDGALSPEEEAELRALAATSVEDAQAFEAFRPLDSDFRARMVETIWPLVSPVPAEVAPPVETPVREERPRPVREETSRRGFTFPWWRPVFVGPGLAAAAAALYLMLRLPPVPPFMIADLKSGVDMERGAGTTEVPALLAGEEFTAVAHPARKLPARAEIEPRCYVLPPPPAEIYTVKCTSKQHPETGAMKINGQLPQNLPTGPATLWIVLANRGDQPKADDVERLPTIGSTRTRNWDAEPIPIEVQAP